jgi:GNAT superfamily N-acetyltransferase
MPEIRLRTATATDYDDLCALVFGHGSSEWNYLPVDEVKHHLREIPTQAQAVLAHDGDQLVGTATYVPHQYPKGPITRDLGDEVVFIAEVVVHTDFRGRGVGRSMLEYVALEAKAAGAQAVYIDRHGDNAASGAMMENAGFALAVTYLDPQRRTNGSGLSAVHMRKVR